jgi:hypothetical protein
MPEIDFEAILTHDFRWPTKGDRAFKASPRWEDDAHLDQHGHGRMVMMMGGYKKGADLMVARATEHRFDRDMLVFPIIFNYRQFLELSLKFLISTYGPTVGVEAVWTSHSLTDLWARFTKVLAGYGDEGDPDGTYDVVRKVVLEFAKVDPASFSFRYPVDPKGKRIDLRLERLDLGALAGVMNGVEGYFTGCDGYLDHLQSAGP